MSTGGQLVAVIVSCAALSVMVWRAAGRLLGLPRPRPRRVMPYQLFAELDRWQQEAYLRHRLHEERCRCRKYCIAYGSVDARDGFRHGETLCQPRREAVDA